MKEFESVVDISCYRVCNFYKYTADFFERIGDLKDWHEFSASYGHQTSAKTSNRFIICLNFAALSIIGVWTYEK